MKNPFINVVSYLQNVSDKSIRKEDVIYNIEEIQSIVNDVVIPSLEQVIDDSNLSYINENKSLSVLAGFLRVSTNREALLSVLDTFTNISKEYKGFLKTANNELGEVLTNKTLNARELFIIKIGNDLSDFCFYTTDYIINVILSPEKDDISTSEKRVEDLKSGLPDYQDLISSYRDFKDVVKNITNIPKYDVNLSGNEKYILKNLSNIKTRVDLPVTSFKGNPVLTIGMWLVDRDIKKLARAEEEKRLIESKLADLKLRENNESDPKIKKIKEYYEDKLSKTDMEINRLKNK